MNPPARSPLPRRAWAWLLVSSLVVACGSGGIGAFATPSPASDPSSRSPNAAAAALAPTPGLAGPTSSDAAGSVSSPPGGSVLAPSPSPDAVSGLVPSPLPTASPSPPVPEEQTTWAPFAIDLYRHGDFVSQARSDWCVPASIQMMARLVDPVAGRSIPGQQTLNRQARALSSSRLVGAGSEPQGWAGVLNRLGYGRYDVVAIRSRSAAIKTAARAIRLTRRPVGLLMWHGAHAWVMSGFSATADPARTSAFQVTSVRVSDPWYPRATSAFGRTRRPDTRLTPAQLATGFLRWHRPLARYAELDGRFVLILPVASTSGS